MDGVINVLKPPGMTSFDIVSFLRGVLKTSKIGHAGTLDPGAVGVLPVFVGRATKAIEFMMDKDKLYRAELTLGVETDTQDSLGNIVSTACVNVTPEQITGCIMSFTGKQQQIPPMYSAIKINGKKLYELAREGKTVDRKPRDIEIYNLNVISISENNKVILDIACSKGTYIRTLCADIGKRLGCGGHMSFLIRLGAGIFNISDSVTLEEISSAAGDGRIQDLFSRTDRVFESFNSITLSENDEKRFLNGLTVRMDGESLHMHDMLKVYNSKGIFIALGKVLAINGSLQLKSHKVF
jgi:tRNA pseudouridine55 synthase